MRQPNSANQRRSASRYTRNRDSAWQKRLHIDWPLLVGILLLMGYGLVILYSASNQSSVMMAKQALRLFLAFCAMMGVANIPPETYRRWAPWLYVFCIVLLLAVLVMGHSGKGAQRWLNLGFFRFQPAEFVKIVIPLFLAWYLSEKRLPPRFSVLAVCAVAILIPVLLTAKQPDLGTALILLFSGCLVLLLAGISWRLMASLSVLMLVSLPVLWHFMHGYQKARVLTFLYPERDPLGSGYHIIQSKIAIGSGGLFGKGWLHGTQSHLHFLPEHATDFIFSVCGEEFGLMGGLLLMGLGLFIAGRGMVIAANAQDSFTRLLAGAISGIFFISMFINMGMVSGILPVVGLPLPLVSYGGTSMVSLLIGFGLLMSIQTHRRSNA